MVFRSARIIVRKYLGKVDLNWRTIRKDVRLLSRIMKLETFAYGIVFTSNEEMKELNARYRSRDTPTDILSFPFHEDIEPGNLHTYKEMDDLNLGDIYLGIPIIKEQSQIFGIDFHDLIVVLLTHGLCHLIGHTHEDVARWRDMISSEASILQEFCTRTGRNCKPITVQPE